MAFLASDPLLDRVVDGRYLVLSRIASGGMATVYLARDQKLGRKVALKVMHAHLALGEGGANFVSRFHREAKASASLAHPGLVAIFDQGTDGEISYLAMEYVAGGNLRAVLARHSTLSVGRSLEITAQLLEALAVAHSKGLVHRDIKPENVLIDAEDRVKLADFGLARAVTDVTSSSTGTLFGTVAYLSPELITKGLGDTRSDLYAIGVMLFEMISGRPPVTGESPIHIAFQHANADIAPLDTLVPALDPVVTNFVAGLVHRDPDMRPADAAAALEHLRSILSQLSESARALRAVPLPTSPVIEPAGINGQDGTEQLGDTAQQDDADSPLLREPPAPLPPIQANVISPRPALDPDKTQVISVGSGTTAALPVHEFRKIIADSDAKAVPGKPLPPRLKNRRPKPTSGKKVPEKQTARLKTSPSQVPQTKTISKPGPNRRGRLLSVWILVLVLLGAGTYGGFYWWNNVGPGAYTLVPTNLVSATLDHALSGFSGLDLDTKVTTAYHDEVATDHVIKVNPQEGERVRKGTTVTLTQSLGIEHHQVPTKIPGMTEDQARATLEEAGFDNVKATETYATGTSAKTVLQISVEEGQSLPHNAEIVLTVSKGPEPVEIPNAVGKTQQGAEEEFAKLELKVEVEEAFDGSIPKGEVISQSPNAATAGHRGDQVTITVSKGPEMIEVPNVIGNSAAKASRALEGRGFKVKIEYHMGGFFDLVRTQSTGGGKTLPKGSTVTITII